MKGGARGGHWSGRRLHFAAAMLLDLGDTFGGLYIEQNPYRVVLLTTDLATVTFDSSKAIPGVPVSVAHAPYSLRELETLQHSLAASFAETGAVVDLRVPLNRVVVEVPTGASMGAASLAALPGAAIVAYGAEPRVPTTTLRGGLTLSGCTSGWTVYYGSNTSNRGITTAGHCSNSQSYAGNPLTYQGDEVHSGNYDVQTHKLAGASYTAQFQVGSGSFRYVTSKLFWLYQNVGDWVCHYGATTLYGCGYIVSDHDPGCMSPIGSYYIKVDSNPNGSGQDLSEGGDSGGPWFINYTALGTMSCQQGQDGIYSTVGFVEGPIGAHILLN